MDDPEALAPFPRRIAAGALDLILVVGSAFVLQAVLIAVGVDEADATAFGVSAAVLVAFFLLPVLLSRPGPSNGQTPGKRALGLRVVRTDGAELRLGTALLRESFGRWGLGLLPFYLAADPVYALIDPRRQAVHDKLARTLVLHELADAEDRSTLDPFGGKVPDDGWDFGDPHDPR